MTRPVNHRSARATAALDRHLQTPGRERLGDAYDLGRRRCDGTTLVQLVDAHLAPNGRSPSSRRRSAWTPPIASCRGADGLRQRPARRRRAPAVGARRPCPRRRCSTTSPAPTSPSPTGTTSTRTLRRGRPPDQASVRRRRRPCRARPHARRGRRDRRRVHRRRRSPAAPGASSPSPSPGAVWSDAERRRAATTRRARPRPDHRRPAAGVLRAARTRRRRCSASELEPEAIIDRLLDDGLDQTAASFGAILLLDGGSLRLAGASVTGRQVIPDADRLDQASPFAQVARSGEPLFLPDDVSIKRYVEEHGLPCPEATTRAWAIVPLHGDRTGRSASSRCASRSRSRSMQAQRSFLVQVGDRLATALERGGAFSAERDGAARGGAGDRAGVRDARAGRRPLPGDDSPRRRRRPAALRHQADRRSQRAGRRARSAHRRCRTARRRRSRRRRSASARRCRRTLVEAVAHGVAVRG